MGLSFNNKNNSNNNNTHVFGDSDVLDRIERWQAHFECFFRSVVSTSRQHCNSLETSEVILFSKCFSFQVFCFLLKIIQIREIPTFFASHYTSYSLTHSFFQLFGFLELICKIILSFFSFGVRLEVELRLACVSLQQMSETRNFK